MFCERITVALVVLAAIGAAIAARYFDVRLLDGDRAEAEIRTGGNVEHGQHAIAAYGCGTCHRIPGIRGARGVVGPSLDHFSERIYIARSHPNTTDNLIRWIMHLTRAKPGTAMPEMGVTETDARDIAALLYSGL